MLDLDATQFPALFTSGLSSKTRRFTYQTLAAGPQTWKVSNLLGKKLKITELNYQLVYVIEPLMCFKKNQNWSFSNTQVQINSILNE